MAADNDKNQDGPRIGAHREGAAQQSWVPAKPTQQDQGGPAADPAEAAGMAAEAAGTIPGSTSTVTHTTTVIEKEKKELTAKEKLEAGVNGIISGNGGPEQGKMIGEAVGAGIKNLFGQGGKGAEPPKAEGPAIGGHRQQGQGTKQEGQETGGLDVGGSLGKKVGGMLGSAIGGEKGKTVGQMLGKAVGNAAGQVADMAVDHARGIGGGVGSAIGGAIGGEKGAAAGKDLGKNIGSGVKSVRDTLAGQGVQLGAKQAPAKQSHGLK